VTHTLNVVGTTAKVAFSPLFMILTELKKKLLTQVEPVHYNPLKEIKLSVDASYYAIWGMLLQKEKINETEE